MAQQYQVIAPCIVHIPVATAMGPMLETFYRDAILPSAVPAERIAHLLDSGLIRKVHGGEPEGEDGRTVNSRASKAELVEYGVAVGGDRAELEALNREQLLDRYVRQQQ